MNGDTDILTLFHTVRHLKPVQIYKRVQRNRPQAAFDTPMARRAAPGAWTPAIPAQPARTSAFRFVFLNKECEPAGWNDADLPKLWLYNLHYFDSPHADLMSRWVRENPAGRGNGWEPYPLSRRIVNWIKLEFAGGVLERDCFESLAAQVECLSNCLEYRLLANHLFANAKALVFAGLFFSGRDAERWLQTGLKILDEQVPEQILSDGGHFERSPMYHSIVLEDLLDLLNLAGRYHEDAVNARVSTWRTAAAKMAGWLRNVRHPDGQISFFNDAVFGIAPEPRSLFEYGARLAVQTERLPLGESGYVRLENADTVVIFDAAPIGPDYQPGHGHADALSFEVSHHGRRLIVNSGISTYEPGVERRRQRGTAAHNTVEVDGADQSEVWAAFRVGRRARTFDVRTDHATFVEASHNGYRRLKQAVIHRRSVELSQAGLLVSDTLEGSGVHDASMYFHVHPDAHAEIELDEKLTRSSSEDGTWHPKFNVSVPNRKIAGHFHGAVPISFRTLIALP